MHKEDGWTASQAQEGHGVVLEGTIFWISVSKLDYLLCCCCDKNAMTKSTKSPWLNRRPLPKYHPISTNTESNN